MFCVSLSFLFVFLIVGVIHSVHRLWCGYICLYLWCVYIILSFSLCIPEYIYFFNLYMTVYVWKFRCVCLSLPMFCVCFHIFIVWILLPLYLFMCLYLCVGILVFMGLLVFVCMCVYICVYLFWWICFCNCILLYLLAFLYQYFVLWSYFLVPIGGYKCICIHVCILWLSLYTLFWL